MSFLHPVLLGLLALAAVPVILHFLMRPKPKRLLFPALRLIEARRKTNVRRLRLRHVWLLLLRIALVALIVFAIARPLVPAANYGLTVSETARLAAVAIVCALGYFAALRFWGRRTEARHEFLYRRTLMRGATGFAAAMLVLLLVAWPYARRVSAEVADPGRVLAEDRPVASVFLFDTSRSMDYQFEGATRLDAAKRIALAHLATLPSGSRIAVADSAGQAPIVFQADLAGARQRIDDLRTQAQHAPLEDRARAAVDLQRQDREQGLGEQAAVPEDLRRDPFVRAVYLFTDMAGSAWSENAGGTLRQRLEDEKWLQVYLVDLGVEQPSNMGIAAARPSEEVATQDTRVMIRADLSAVGRVPAETAVELFVDAGAGPIKQGQATITVKPGEGGRVEFPLANLAPPFVRGELRLARSDPFGADDVRFFTVGVEPSAKVLIASDRQSDSFLWATALTARKYDAKSILTPLLARERLEDYDVVYLLNVEAPRKTDWERLAAYVAAGGGAGVLLGKRVDSSLYNDEAAQSLLPAKLLAQVAFTPPERFRPLDDGHPVFAKFQEVGAGYGWLTSRLVKRHYLVEPDEDAATIASYTYDAEMRPALIVRSTGTGRTALLTTGVDTTRGWSELPNAGWPYLAFADQLTQFLSGRTGGRRNFTTGEDAALRLVRSKLPDRLLVRTPDLEQRPVDVPQDGQRLTIPGLSQVGHYELASPPGGPKFASGFSVNLPANESDFTRIAEQDLDARLGQGRYSIARDPGSLAVAVRDTTLGAELMPYVLMLLVAVFCGEHLVANRFYDAEQSPEHH